MSATPRMRTKTRSSGSSRLPSGGLYNDSLIAYNTAMSSGTSQVMRVSRNGQVSLPAETRHRWNAEQVLVVDLGDHVVMRPLPEDPAGALYGRYAGKGPTAAQARRQARGEEAAVERRRTTR